MGVAGPVVVALALVALEVPAAAAAARGRCAVGAAAARDGCARRRCGAAGDCEERRPIPVGLVCDGLGLGYWWMNGSSIGVGHGYGVTMSSASHNGPRLHQSAARQPHPRHAITRPPPPPPPPRASSGARSARWQSTDPSHHVAAAAARAAARGSSNQRCRRGEGGIALLLRLVASSSPLDRPTGRFDSIRAQASRKGRRHNSAGGGHRAALSDGWPWRLGRTWALDRLRGQE